ncbi:unnamed protein product, partial [Musa hybrid cultivar]
MLSFSGRCSTGTLSILWSLCLPTSRISRMPCRLPAEVRIRMMAWDGSVSQQRDIRSR